MMEASDGHKSSAEEEAVVFPPLWSESSVIVILMSIICLKQRRTAEGGGRLWRVQPNIQIISDLIRILLFYKSWTSQDWAGRNSSGSRYGHTPGWPKPATCLCAIKSENSSINRVKKEYKSQSFHAYWMYVLCPGFKFFFFHWKI